MVIHLDNTTWTYVCKDQKSIPFASFSTLGTATITITLNGEMLDRVNTTVPHSWWNNAFCPTMVPGDVLTVSCNGIGDLRLDLS